jgi:hypothetical protein
MMKMKMARIFLRTTWPSESARRDVSIRDRAEDVGTTRPTPDSTPIPRPTLTTGRRSPS